MERVVFKAKTRPRVDRFIASRESLPELRWRLLWDPNCDKPTVDIGFHKYFRAKRYINHLAEAFGLETQKMPDYRPSEDDDSVKSWPCVPRKKAYLSLSNNILDLPTYNSAAFPELIDWSTDNILVAAFGKNYFEWSWRTQSRISQGQVQHKIQCCKFDPSGEMLLLGTNKKVVEIHNKRLSKSVCENRCQCSEELCAVTAAAWSPSGNSFITGCSRGMLVSFERCTRPISCRREYRTAVLVVRVSPNERYVAAAAVNSKHVSVLTWPDLEVITYVKCDWIVKTLTWHPWRGALLAVGAVTSNHQTLNVTLLGLLDVPSDKLQERTLSGRYYYNLDTMLFSHTTGELVLSLRNCDPATSYESKSSHLLVMSDLDTLVDHWGEGRWLDPVRTMLFSPDGTKLATATAEEDLIFWNFLPEDKNKSKVAKSKRFSALPVYLDEATPFGFSLR